MSSRALAGVVVVGLLVAAGVVAALLILKDDVDLAPRRASVDDAAPTVPTRPLAGPSGREEPAKRPRAPASSQGGLAGRVLDEDGGAVAGAMVSLQDSDSRSLLARLETDAGGGFRMTDSEPGPVRIVVEACGFAIHSETARLEPGGTASLEIVLATRPEFVGQVLDASRRPVEDAAVTIAYLSDEDGAGNAVPGEWIRRTSGVGGWFSYPSTDDARFRTPEIRARKEGIGSGRAESTVGFPIREVILRKTRTLTCRFQPDDGSESPRLGLELRSGKFSLVADTDESGVFVVDELPIGDGFSLTIHEGGWWLSPEAVPSQRNWRHFEIPMRGDADVAIPIRRAASAAPAPPKPDSPPPASPPCRLVVQVIGPNGRGAADMGVTIAPCHGGSPRTATTGGEGRAVFEGLERGLVAVKLDPAAVGPGIFWEDDCPSTISLPKLELGPFVIRLHPEVVLSGHVTLQDGSALGGGTAKFHPAAGPAAEAGPFSSMPARPRGPPRFARLNERGEFTLRIRSALDYELSDVTRIVRSSGAPLRLETYAPIAPAPLAPGAGNPVVVKQR